MGSNKNPTKLVIKVLFPDLKKTFSRNPLIVYLGCAKSTLKCVALGAKENGFNAIFLRIFIVLDSRIFLDY